MELDITVNYSVSEADFAQLGKDYPTGEYVKVGKEGEIKTFRLKIRSGSERNVWTTPHISLLWFLV
tara:strand:- start:237 stop:434 length:198 start_codon:yes stop_codon:yes gene_type:complete